MLLYSKSREYFNKPKKVIKKNYLSKFLKNLTYLPSFLTFFLNSKKKKNMSTILEIASAYIIIFN